MKMIRNKNEMVPGRTLLVLLIGVVLIGIVRRSCNATNEALEDSLLRRFGTPLCPTIPARDLTQLAGLVHQWLRGVASITVSGLLSRSGFGLKHARTVPQGDAA